MVARSMNSIRLFRNWKTAPDKAANMHRTGVILLAAAIIGACLMIAGCQKRERGVTTIRFATWGNEVVEKDFRERIALFEKHYPHIKVELEITPWARVMDKLMISSAGGRPPDVACVSSLWYAPIAAKGLLEPLHKYVERDNYDIEDFYTEAIEGWGKYKGVLYGIPIDIDVYAVYFNKDMFDKYSQPYPDWSWDWNKYLEVARALTKDFDEDGKLDQWGCTVDTQWQNYVFQNGGEVMSADWSKCLLDQPAAYQGLQFMSDLVNRYHVSPNAEESVNIGPAKLFTAGKTGMIFSGSWASELIFKHEIKNFTFDVGPVPSGPKARATFIGGGAYTILAQSKHKDEAWEFVKWMSRKEGHIKLATQLHMIPARRSIAESGAYLKRDTPPKSRKVFLEMIKYGRAPFTVPCSPEMNQIIASELDLVRLGKEPAKEACERVTPVIDQLLRHQE